MKDSFDEDIEDILVVLVCEGRRRENKKGVRNGLQQTARQSELELKSRMLLLLSFTFSTPHSHRQAEITTLIPVDSLP